MGLGQIGSKWIFSDQDIFDCFNIIFFHALMTIPIVLKHQRRKLVTTNQNNGTFFKKWNLLMPPTKVCLVKAMVFPIVMYGSKS